MQNDNATTTAGAVMARDFHDGDAGMGIHDAAILDARTGEIPVSVHSASDYAGSGTGDSIDAEVIVSDGVAEAFDVDTARRIDVPAAVDRAIPPNAYDFLRVEFAGITKRERGDYQVSFLQPEFVERELHDPGAGRHEKPPVHMIHVLTMLRDKIVETYNREIAVFERQHALTGSVPATTEVRERKDRLPRTMDELPVFVAPGTDEELEIAQGNAFRGNVQ
ncbi:MAG: hypothetical protein ACTHKB_15725 [Burkholderiaceae bacterium]